MSTNVTKLKFPTYLCFQIYNIEDIKIIYWINNESNLKCQYKTRQINK